MSYIPTILIIGDSRLKTDVSANLPQGSNRVVHCDSVEQALDRAADASVVLINAEMPGTEDFCRRLRADAITASIPLLLRGASHQGAPYADETLSTNLQQTLDVLYTYLPELLDPANYADDDEVEELDDADLFDLNESTVIWRRPEGVDDWPQPPPERQPGEDMLDHTRGYAGYVNSLVEAYDSPEFASAGHVRLDEMSHRVVGSMDELLSTIQNSVNDALRAGDLQRMRELSAAKNVLFEKLQRLRTIQNSEKRAHAAKLAERRPAAQASANRASADEASADEASAGSPGGLSQALAAPLGPLSTGPHTPPSFDGEGGPASNLSAGAALETTGPQRKSRLTLAAEAKDAERVKREREREQKLATQRASARKTSARQAEGESAFASRTLWLLIVAIAVAGGSGFYLWRVLRSDSPQRVNSTNKPPVMRFVTIQETLDAVIAHPSAKDPEGDPINYAIRWSVNGTPIASIAATRLPKAYYKPGQTVVVQITPADPNGSGEPMASRPLKITGTIQAPKEPPEPASDPE